MVELGNFMLSKRFYSRVLSSTQSNYFLEQKYSAVLNWEHYWVKLNIINFYVEAHPSTVKLNMDTTVVLTSVGCLKEIFEAHKMHISLYFLLFNVAYCTLYMNIENCDIDTCWPKVYKCLMTSISLQSITSKNGYFTVNWTFPVMMWDNGSSLDGLSIYGLRHWAVFLYSM